MRATAGFLKFGCSVIMFFEGLAAILLAGVEGALIFMGSFSEIARKTGNAITINDTSMTPAEMDALKPMIMVALGVALLSVILAIIGTTKTRSAYAECREERPFSDKCVKSLLSAARLEIIGGIVGVIGAVILSTMVGSITVSGVKISSSMNSMNISFIIYAVQKYLFYHVADYGRKLENRQAI